MTKLPTQNEILDHVKATLHLKNDAAISRRLQIAPPVISKLRHGLLSVGPSLLINIHEETGTSIKDLKGLINT